ncbi:unnamed protein product [Aureobasidium mustum]|uniref:Uncharacterized protein n=1 Tax=Aureobasidium mustum TaxID=2773714 RepID=A0A9N8JWD0_9PEZI|nr:unnamed protein product [Aureobasidium mustum]
MYTTVAANTRALNSGMAYWTEANTIPAGPQNVPPSPQQQTRPPKKSRFARLRNFLRLDANTNDHGRSCRCIRCLQVRGQLTIQVIQEPRPSFSPATPRRAPTPPRRRNSSPQISRTSPPLERPVAKRIQTGVNNKPLPYIPSLTPQPPGASGYIPPQPVRGPIRRKPLPPGASVFIPNQPPKQPFEPSDPVSPISPSAQNACFDSVPISPVSPAISMTASEPDFDQTRINRMSTYSYLDGNTDLSAFATTPYAETFAIRSATPISFRKAKPVEVWAPVRSATPFRPRIERPKLTLQLRSVSVNRPEILRSPSINPMGCVAGSQENSPSSASTDGASDTSTDNGSLGTHARILKKVLVESLEGRSLIRDSFVPK